MTHIAQEIVAFIGVVGEIRSTKQSLSPRSPSRILIYEYPFWYSYAMMLHSLFSRVTQADAIMKRVAEIDALAPVYAVPALTFYHHDNRLSLFL